MTSEELQKEINYLKGISDEASKENDLLRNILLQIISANSIIEREGDTQYSKVKFNFMGELFEKRTVDIDSYISSLKEILNEIILKAKHLLSKKE